MRYFEDLGYVYPEKSDEHMITVKKLREVKVDTNYRYYDKTLWFRIKRIGLWILLQLIIFPLLRLSHGLKVEGKKNFKKYKHLYKDGAITICNHVFMWDYLCVLKAIRPHLQYLIAWKTNLEGSNGPLIRLVGGVPVPTDDMRAMLTFSKTIKQIFDDKQWLHVFPEGSMWFFYPDIRPLKQAVFRMAVEHDKPIIPLAISFRKRKGLYKLFKKTPCATIHIGEPLLYDKTLHPKEAAIELQKRAYHVMQTMVGINPGDPTYNEDLNINNYKSTV